MAINRPLSWHHHSDSSPSSSSSSSSLASKAGSSYYFPSRPITAQNIVPGQKRDQSSYRAELGMSIKLTNAILCRKKRISTGKVTLGCDCKGAIQAVKGDQIVSSCLNSYDLLYHIQKEIRQSPMIDWEFKWVWGHQDRKKKKKDLDIWAQSHNICRYVSLVEEDIIICLSYMSYPRSAADHTFLTRSCKRIVTNIREKTLIFSHN